MQRKIFFTILIYIIFFNYAFPKSGSQSTGIIPSAPPVNLHTSLIERKYKGYGYLNFSVVLPVTATPEFSLGSDEGAEYELGNVNYVANGFVYVDKGFINSEKSTEEAWIFGVLTGAIEEGTFIHEGQTFSISHDRSGFFGSKRYSFSKRIDQKESFNVDYNFTSMFSVFFMSGNTRMDSGPVNFGNSYISDYDEQTYGFAYRPTITLQPTFEITDSWSFIPFIGASAFISASFNTWYVNEWEDYLYGTDCQYGCPDSNLTFGFIPIELMIGFDIEWDVNETDTISLSSFFSPALASETESMSEIYILYSTGF